MRRILAQRQLAQSLCDYSSNIISTVKNPPQRFILAKQPREYLVQGLSHCGAYSVKAILSFYDKDDGRKPEEYHTGKLGRVLGTTFGQHHWVNVLKSHGVKAEAGRASHLNDMEKLDLLKAHLSKNNPIMISIGNGYLPKGHYSRLKSFFLGHWITLWGYDDAKQTYYVYDSAVPKDLYDQNIPIGNKARTYKEVVRDWGTPVFTRIAILIPPTGNFYISPTQ